MNYGVVITAWPGNVWNVTVEPAVPLIDVARQYTDFECAVGYAAGLAAGLARPLIDGTGHFSPLECEELVAHAMTRLVTYALPQAG